MPLPLKPAGRAVRQRQKGRMCRAAFCPYLLCTYGWAERPRSRFGHTERIGDRDVVLNVAVAGDDRERDPRAGGRIAERVGNAGPQQQCCRMQPLVARIEGKICNGVGQLPIK